MVARPVCRRGASPPRPDKHCQYRPNDPRSRRSSPQDSRSAGVPKRGVHQMGLSQLVASRVCGFRYSTSLNKIEKDRNGGAVHVATLERVHDSYSRLVPSVFSPMEKLTRLVNGGLQWDEVAEVIDTGRFEAVYDLEVRPSGAHIENFLAGYGGIFVSNTAGFI